MRPVKVLLQTTLNNRIANADGGFWEPFPFGQEENVYLNEWLRDVDTWALSRVFYDIIVPWWDDVAAGNPPDDAGELGPAELEFARSQATWQRVVFSNSMTDGPQRTVISGDLAPQLAALKDGPGGDILLACGPATLGPLADAPGLIDEYLVVIHPAVLAAGPGMFEALSRDLQLELVESRVFEAGAIMARYRVLPS